MVVGLAASSRGLIVVLGGRQLGGAQDDVLQLGQEPLHASQHQSKGKTKVHEAQQHECDRFAKSRQVESGTGTEQTIVLITQGYDPKEF